MTKAAHAAWANWRMSWQDSCEQRAISPAKPAPYIQRFLPAAQPESTGPEPGHVLNLQCVMD